MEPGQCVTSVNHSNIEKMLRTKVLPEILEQVVGDGITACMLMTLEGALVGSVGDGDAVEHKVVGAVASHTWSEYQRADKEANSMGDLSTLLVELEASSKSAALC
ncbi:hypothetical protein PsorP6_002822 [Peronosclerospora sorghi]|uniref:Uncharacterized protein n=1 Tax=Peronosclerospora sorghi TaxID=230839 RepID=A0ACC0VQG6_9STRA|nr:hypothetical protein PsorP6_002822 [Peronosclerospora sorghi]